MKTLRKWCNRGSAAAATTATTAGAPPSAELIIATSETTSIAKAGKAKATLNVADDGEQAYRGVKKMQKSANQKQR